jgi:hypothetical protein
VGSDEVRAAERGDYLRVMALLESLELHAAGEYPGEPLWRVHEQVRADREGDGGFDAVPGADGEPLIGEELLAADMHFARILLESHAHGRSGRIPKDLQAYIPRVCSTPGCPNSAVWNYCDRCTLGLSSDVEGL